MLKTRVGHRDTVRPTMLSIVIPTLNAADGLASTLSSLTVWPGPIERIIADGGSTDTTLQIATDFGAHIVTAEPGRGSQLATGATAAKGEWLLFLHADTTLSPNWPEAAQMLMAQPELRAGYFRFRLNDASPQARIWENRIAWRCQKWGLPYGDQGLLISRTHYDMVGGYKPIPLMEDVDLVRRLGPGGLMPLEADAMTSARKFQRDGYWWRSTRNVTCLSLYFLGFPPLWLKRLYG